MPFYRNVYFSVNAWFLCLHTYNATPLRENQPTNREIIAFHERVQDAEQPTKKYTSLQMRGFYVVPESA